MVETGSDRAGGNAKNVSDRGRLVPEVMAKDEEGAFLRPEPSERPIHDVSVDNARELIGRDLAVKGQNLEIRVAASVSTSVLDAHVRQHALDPEVKPVRIAEVRQVSPGDHQRVLQGILGPVDIAEDPARDRVQAIEAGAGQVDEGDLIATLRRDHELSIHRRISADVRGGRRSNDSGGWCAVSVERIGGVEQVAYANVGDAGFTAMNRACSGFRSFPD